jgi:hypothetical protein
MNTCRAWSALLIPGLLVVAACGGAGEDHFTNDGNSVQPTANYLRNSFDVDVAESTLPNGISIAHNVGWVIRPDSTEQVPVFLYSHMYWDAISADVYSGLGVSSTELVPIWFYCNGSGWITVWYESTADGTMRCALALGTCSDARSATTQYVELPASTLALDHLVTSFTVSGSQVSVDGSGRGSMTFAEATWNLAVFGAVDCTSCGTPGWYELHSLYWRRDSPDICFGILYLTPGSQIVQLAWSMCLPSLADPTGGSIGFDATWTVSGGASP